MEDHLLGIFEAELETQCKFILMGAVQVNAALSEKNVDAVWFGLQSILISASNASKLLWGAGRTDEEAHELHEARKPLRERVEVEDSSPLNDRMVRNSFEHFDERLDKWFARSEDHNYLGRNIGPPGAIIVNDAIPTDHFGLFDPSSATVWFWERSAKLNPITQEAERIRRILEERRRGPMA